MRRFYASASQFSGNSIELDADETRHLRDVLRLTSGDNVSVFNGTGQEFECSILEIGKRTARLVLVGEIPAASPESPLDITIAPTVLNGDRYDLIVQKAVELGVTTLVPLITIRCEMKAADAGRRLSRWRRIALEATKQSGRAKIMEIVEPQTLDRGLADAEKSTAILFSERDGANLPQKLNGKTITAFYGPKGGWDDSELDLARSLGVSIVTLRGRILRAETASIAITAILQHRFGDLN
ncbi:MAG: 16S rRNA (uracil(1498)-N(3))-methyltransferase [Pyrinomonadaceae bacterium]